MTTDELSMLLVSQGEQSPALNCLPASHAHWTVVVVRDTSLSPEVHLHADLSKEGSWSAGQALQ